MKSQRNFSQLKEKEKILEKTTRETDINSSPYKEFEALVMLGRKLNKSDKGVAWLKEMQADL